MKSFGLKFILFITVISMLVSACATADSVVETSNSPSVVPQISAIAYVLSDAKTGEVLFAQNENQRMPVASTTKVMTCLVALENSSLDDVVTVSSDCCGIEGSSMYLYKGEKITVRDLLYGLMLESANDAAVCIANHVSGSIEAFADLMNGKAKELSLENTHFNNPHGLEDPEHYSTAYDMAELWRAAMSNENFRRIVATETYKIKLDDKEGYRFLSNHNKLLKSTEYCIGGKTGYTKTAGRCLISGSEKNGAELVMVTLNAPDDWSDHKTLLDYAFSLYSTVEVATPGSVTHSLAVVGGNKKQLTLCNAEAQSVSLRDVSRLETQIRSPRFVYAPIKDLSKPLAYVVYSVEGKEVALLPLYPQEKVELFKKPSFFDRVLKLFK